MKEQLFHFLKIVYVIISRYFHQGRLLYDKVVYNSNSILHVCLSTL
jgi:hypothetical protein